MNPTIFVDDLRVSPSMYDLTFRNGEDLITYLKKKQAEDKEFTIGKLSLDHDLGEGIMDGYDIVKQLAMLEPMIRIENLQFHTSNPTGWTNMFKYVLKATQHGLFYPDMYVEPRVVEVIDGVESFASFRFGEH